MHKFVDARLEEMVVQSYAAAFARHGDLNLQLEEFMARLFSIIEKRLGGDSLSSAAFDLVNGLHVNDLYLAFACAKASDAAWSIFASLYGDIILRICNCVCRSSNTARELADSLPGQLFLPDAKGRSRIASYDGISLLSTWLTAIIKHRAEKERRLKFNNFDSIERLPDLGDETSILEVETSIRASKFQRPITDSLRHAILLLSDRERTIVRLRYDQQLQVRQIALMFGVKPQAITQQIERSRLKLRKRILSALAASHGLRPEAVEECVARLLSDPEHSALSLSKEEWY